MKLAKSPYKQEFRTFIPTQLLKAKTIIGIK